MTGNSAPSHRVPLEGLVRRLRAACRTNEPQITAVIMFSMLNLLAALGRENTPWWLYVAVGLFWPMVAFIFNLIDPIPKRDA